MFRRATRVQDTLTGPTAGDAPKYYWNSFSALITVWITPQVSGMPTKPQASTRCSGVVVWLMQAAPSVGYAHCVGFLVRHTWEPLSRRPVWLSLGTGWELGQVSIDHHGSGTSSGHDDLLTYNGREYLRVGAGVDFRPNHVLGFGLYGSFGFGAYDTLKDPTQSASLDRSNHTTAQVGIRLILFP